MRTGIVFLAFLHLLAASELITPIPKSIPHDPKKAHLGERLFFDPQLSRDGTIACASCHVISEGGAEHKSVSVGIDGQKGLLNAPTVLNAVFNIAQFWDGRADDLREQAKGPIVNPLEMGNSFENLIATLKKDKEYAKSFRTLYPEGITADTIADAISEYEKTLITPGSRFDRYLEGNATALNRTEKEGFELFKSKGCISCHHGVNIGGNQYQRFGAVIPNSEIGKNSPGRFNVTGDPDDRYYLKVPSLRNIAKTAPFFHTGSVKTLHQAVRLMSYHQLGIELKPNEIDKIVRFLLTLSADIPGAYNAEK